MQGSSQATRQTGKKSRSETNTPTTKYSTGVSSLSGSGDREDKMEQLHQTMSSNEQMVASPPLATSNKRQHEEQDVEMKDDTTCNGRCAKKARLEEQQQQQHGQPEQQQQPLKAMMKKAPHHHRTLRPAPFFLYKDHSDEPDPDPLTPLTAPGRVPNFPAKMHAILSRKDFADVVAWLPHGRSWRVLKPREFEVKVLPKFFEHAKFSSFVRQANGWGFRRITQGKDRNSYYHEKFLRGLPHLSKGMMRPKVAEKLTADPSQEPDFYKISELHPLPEKIEDDEAILLQCTLQGGPRARVPIYSGAMGALTAASLPKKTESLQFQQSLVAPDNSMKPAAQPAAATAPPAGVAASVPLKMAPQPQPQPAPPPTMPLPAAAAYLNASIPPQAMLPGMGAAGQPAAASTFAALASANQLSMQAAALNATAASQFAAGFAAATAFSQHQFRNMMLAAQQQQQQQQPPAPSGVQNPSNFGFPPCGFR